MSITCNVPSHRQALTLIEVLVVFGIVALLAALLFPAAQMTREAARRLSCASNLKQVHIAISQYETTWGCYPPGSFRFRLLPYMGETALYDLPRQTGLSIWDDHYWDVVKNKCPGLFRCPSDPAPNTGPGLEADSSNYMGCGGTWNVLNGWDGIFTIPGENHKVLPGNWVKVRDVADGLSNTALCSESLRSDGTNHRLRKAWETPEQYNDLDEFRQVCESLPPEPADFGWHGIPMIGDPWYGISFAQAMYNHALPPNRPTCLNKGGAMSGLFTVASLHPGGVNVMFADGHLTFVSESIDR